MKNFYLRNEKQILFYALPIVLLLAFCSWFLLAKGMFFDGVLYAAISKNMALGEGTFWAPYLSPLWPEFYEHPPLVFFIESIPFRLFGTSLLIERFFSIANYIVIAVLMFAIWKQRVKEIKTAWALLFLYFLIPLITWAATNNLLDSTMSVFVCLSVYLYFKSASGNKSYLFLILSSLSICCAVLCKGPVGFFPCSLPFILWLTTREISFRKAVVDTFFLVFFSILPITLFYFISDAAKNGLDSYITQQVEASLKGDRNTVDNRFWLIRILFKELLIPICIVLLFWIISHFKKVQKQILLKSVWRKECLLFLLLALAGSLPILLSMKQRGMYLIPAMPFFIIALTLSVKGYIDVCYEKIKSTSLGFKIFRVFIVTAFIIVIVFTISRKGAVARDSKIINIVTECSKVIPPNSIISVNKSLTEDWALYSYLNRISCIYMDLQPSEHDYFLCETAYISSLNFDKYEKILEVEDKTLFKLK